MLTFIDGRHGRPSIIQPIIEECLVIIEIITIFEDLFVGPLSPQR